MAALKEGFSTPEVSRLTGVVLRTIQYWVTTGLLTPGITIPGGIGRPARWSFTDVVAVRVIRELREAGASVQSLRRVKDVLAPYFEHPFAQAWLVCDGVDVYLHQDRRTVMSLLKRPGQLGYARVLLDVPAVVEELTRAVAELKAAG